MSRTVAILVALLIVGAAFLGVPDATAAEPPPAGGYFALQGAGSFASLPGDTQAASMVHRSTWEPRPENDTANHTTSSNFATQGYSGMENHAALFGRVTGNFTGTTDEIIQWAAAKWGLPDDVVRAEAVVESSWYQNHKDPNPISGEGYGDFGDCGGSPAPSGYGTGGPASFGIMQIKWCTHKDASAPGYDGWPWSENSTAYNLDYYGAIMRGCIEGWDSWLGNGYAAGDMWGCVGRWYAGAWHTSAAESYISAVKAANTAKAWRGWTDQGTTTTTTTTTPPMTSTTSTTPTTTTTAPTGLTVTITSPTDGATLGNTTAVEATAPGATKMQARVDGDLKKTVYRDTFSWSWWTLWLRAGQHTLQITATGPNGSGEKTITVNR